MTNEDRLNKGITLIEEGLGYIKGIAGSIDNSELREAVEEIDGILRGIVEIRCASL